jgi:hypothetical protein
MLRDTGVVVEGSRNKVRIQGLRKIWSAGFKVEDLVFSV